VEAFRVEVPDAELDDLRGRLRRTRWPESETDPSQGVPLGYLQELCAYWADGYDWRAVEARLNALPQFRSDGIHFIHARSENADALPLILTHGRPGSVLEYLDVIGPLSEDFHVVCPSLPGFGDQILDMVTLYWLTRTGASSARLYWESIRQVNEWISGTVTETVDVPTACSVFPGELQRPSRRWAERRFTDIRYWSEPPRGGHFAAYEQPELFVEEVRAAFRALGAD